MADGWNVVSTTPAPSPTSGSWNVVSKEPAKEPDISLMNGVMETGQTALKSVAGFPLSIVEEVASPIESAKTLYEGAKNIPSTMAQHAKADVEGIGKDLGQVRDNPDYWQKILHGGRAAITLAGSPLDVYVGAPYSSTLGQLAEKSSGGMISADEAAFLPMMAAGKETIIPKKAGAIADKVTSAPKPTEVPPVGKWNDPAKAGVQAQEIIKKRLSESQKVTGETPQQVIDRIAKAQKAGKPMTLADVGGENIKSLAGYLARQPGAAREFARDFLSKRDAAAAQRLTSDVNKHLKTGSVKQTAEGLAELRSKEGRPLWDDAMRGGSIAPLGKQFEQEFRNETKSSFELAEDLHKKMAKMASLKEKQAAAAKKGYTDAGVMEDMQKTKASLIDGEKKLRAIQANKSLIMERMNAVEADKAAGVPGAIWNPRIQRMLDNPNIKKGIAHGINIERNLADAEGRKFDPTEYAIVGEENGVPKLGKVPNMRLLATAKEGLDEMLRHDSMRDPLTKRLNKEGLSIKKLREALVRELDANNPKYKQARDNWAGHSGAMESIRYGQSIFDEKPEEIEAEVKNMTPSEREFARLGLADKIREKILKTGMGGDEAKSIMKNDWVKSQIKPLFRSDKDFNDFVDSVTNEKIMFDTKYKTTGNSMTQERAAEDAANKLGMLGHVGKGAYQMLNGNAISAMSTFLKLKKDLGIKQNPALNEAIAKLMFNPTVTLDQLGIDNVPSN